MIRVGSEVDFPPYAVVDEKGEPAGFSVDLIKAVASTMGLTIRVSADSWDAVWHALVSGTLDVLPIVAKLPERQRMVDFSLPHTETFDAFFVREGGPAIRNIAAAQGMEIVVMRSDAAHHALLERNFQGKLILVDTIPEGLKLVSSGRHDAILCSKLIGTLSLREHGIANVTAGPTIPDYKRVFSFAVKKGDSELLELLNQGLLIVKTNGEYDRIYERWLSFDDPWRKARRYLLPLGYSAIAIILVAGFWLLMLQRLVRKRTRELDQRNEMLRRAHDELEARIRERTGELRKSNQLLQADIAERERAEALLRESEERFHKVFAEGPLGMVMANVGDGTFIAANASFCRMLGYTEPELKRLTFADITHPEHRQADMKAVKRLWAGEIQHYKTEKRYLRKDGQNLWGSLTASLVRGDNGEPLYSLAMIEDISERRRAEERLKASLAEKEVMLREIHHRVKNNMQMMSALLELQSGYVQDAQARGYLRDSQQRIESMAMIHEQLYQDENLARIEFAAYLRTLVDNLRSQYAEQCRHVAIHVEAGACTLPVSTAIPCGLVVNELVSNSLKHGFPGGRAGELRVGLRCQGTDRIVLEVADDGVGMPVEPNRHFSKGFGLRIVRMMVEEQLRGRLSVETDHGTRVVCEMGVEP